jgi:hypothetical protein
VGTVALHPLHLYVLIIVSLTVSHVVRVLFCASLPIQLEARLALWDLPMGSPDATRVKRARVLKKKIQMRTDRYFCGCQMGTRTSWSEFPTWRRLGSTAAQWLVRSFSRDEPSRSTWFPGKSRAISTQLRSAAYYPTPQVIRIGTTLYSH